MRFDLSDTGESILLDATGGGTPEHRGSDRGGRSGHGAPPFRRGPEKLMRGKLSPMLAFSTGRLRVEGSKGVALKLGSLLDED